MNLPNEIEQLYLEACRYDEAGDIYHAVKLWRLILKKDDQFAPAHRKLGQFYKSRGEWKPAYHFHKKLVALYPKEEAAWWNLGIAACALEKPRIMRSVIQKFKGTKLPEKGQLQVVQVNHQAFFELLWVMVETPFSGYILSIPHPLSGLSYKDLVLFDRDITGYQIQRKKRIPVRPFLGQKKRSVYQAFSCLLHNPVKEDLDLLEGICVKEGLGFEIWSNSSMSMSTKQKEFYHHQFGNIQAPQDQILVAFGAKLQRNVEAVLNAWKIISLKDWSELRYY